MKKRLYVALAGLMATLALIQPAAALVEVLHVNGQNLWIAAKTRMVGETTYVSLRSMAEILAPDAVVSWHDDAAWVEGEGLTVRAKPGERYMTVNDRVFYVPDGVLFEKDSVKVPIRAAAKAMGATVDWSRESGVTLTVGSGLPGAKPYSEDDLYWMARIISAESQGEPLEGKIAVGTVVLNRVASKEFPNCIFDVIFDREWGVQFEPTANGTIYHEPTQESVLAAKMVLDGARISGKSLYFYAPSKTNNHWIRDNRPYVTTIGCHMFFA